MRKRGAAIGTFDGVHRGHRIVLKLLEEKCSENDLEPIAITFDRHPLALIDPSREPASLTTLEMRKKLLKEASANPVVVEFNEELRSTSAEDWMKKIQNDHGVELLVIGYDNTFGCDGLNLSVAEYRALGEKTGIEVIVAPELKETSSSAIRKAVKEGEVFKAGEMLGRPYSITGKVVKGNSLGRVLGFPTANLDIPPKMAIPKEGVYSAVVKLPSGEKFPAMVNIGVRPTVRRGDNKVIECHIIGWRGDLYDREITIRFLTRLRDEKKFDSIDELKKQLDKDLVEVLNQNR